MAFQDLSPGIIYLIRRTPALLLPPALTCACLHFYAKHTGLEFGWFVTAAAAILSGPVWFAVALLGKDLNDWRAARALGARLPPRIPDWTPGNVKTLSAELESAREGYVGEISEELSQKLGYTFNYRILFGNRFATADPEHIKAMLATQFDNHEKGPEVRDIFFPLLGTGVFAVDGDLWKFHRSLTRPFFTRERISDFENFGSHADVAIKKVKQRLREGFAVDFQDVAARFTLDSATAFLFGKDVESLSASLPYPYNASLTKEQASTTTQDDPATRFANAFARCQTLLLQRVMLGYHWPLVEFWKDEMKEPLAIVNGLIDPIVTEAIDKKKTKKQEGIKDDDESKRLTLLDDMVDSIEDPIMLRDEIMSLLVAGRDTTASALSLTIYMLAQHDHVFDRLRKEILNKVGPDRHPTYEDIKDMKYLRAVLNETLRLYPIVPFNVRMSKNSTLWPPLKEGEKPYYIPAGSRLSYSIWGMQRRKDLWGPDAEEFDPDRFIDERLQKYLLHRPFIFLPFNAGPRICLGQQSFSKVRLSEEAQPPSSKPPASWKSATGRKAVEKIRPASHLTLHLSGGLWVEMEEARDC